MSSSKRQRSASDPQQPSKKAKPPPRSRRQVVEDASKAVSTSTLRVLSNGRIGVKRLKLKNDTTAKPSPVPISHDFVPVNVSQDVEHPTEDPMDDSIQPVKEKPKKRINTNSASFHVFLRILF
jgi:hypothetical protein